MKIYGYDVASENISAGAFVTLRVKGNFKAPIQQDIEYELVEAKPMQPKTLPKNQSEIIGYYEEE